MTLDSGQWAVIIICAILLAGYILGVKINSKKAQEISAWLTDGLETWGKALPGGRLAGMASGGRIELQIQGGTMRRIEILYLLEPRENLIFWIVHRLYGRRDELVLKLTLKTIPKTEIEISKNNDRSFQKQINHQDKKAFKKLPDMAGFRVAARVENIPARDELHSFLTTYRANITRLRLQHGYPQGFLRIKTPGLMKKPAIDFYTNLQNLIEVWK